MSINYIIRQIEPLIEDNLYKGDVLILYGARQVGKTTLVRHILAKIPAEASRYLNCDEGDIQKLFSEANTSVALRRIIGDRHLVVLDEVQRIRNIGSKLKLLVDTFPEQQIIATGSSSFELANEVVEPLTGRSREFWLYPLSAPELFPGGSRLDFDRELESLLVYGSYPLVYLAQSYDEKKLQLKKIAANYLYKDILKFQNLRNFETVRKLLEALALQVGHEVSYTELGGLIGVSKQTVSAYVDILEKAFIVFKVRPFSRNLRKELSKLRKIYFYDLGIRNALINNLNPLSLRGDVGALWENFVIAEKRKAANFIGNQAPLYFWRTHDGQEIDLVEERGGRLFGHEIKWSKPRRKAPVSWSKTYPDASWGVISRQNFPLPGVPSSDQDQ
jgi:predicted AAA+ superfamily ATPase